MPHQVLFIQGGGSGAHDEWDNKLVDSLRRELGPDYEVHYPRMPNEADPNYARWKAALEKEFSGLSDGAILVGHSNRGHHPDPYALRRAARPDAGGRLSARGAVCRRRWLAQ